MPDRRSELEQELLKRTPSNPLGTIGVILTNKPPEDVIPVQLPERPVREEGAIDRFLAGLVEGVGLPAGDTEGIGLAGLTGYGAGTALTGGLAAVVPPKAARMAANRVIRSVEHPQVKEILEWLRDVKKMPRTLGQMTKVEIGPVPGAYAAANSELEYRIQDLALAKLRAKGITNPTVAEARAAQDEMRRALEKNLSPKRVENLSKVFRLQIDPTAHDNFFDLADSVGHEVRHGTQMMKMGQQFQPTYHGYEQNVMLRGQRPDPNPLEEQAISAGEKVAQDIREWFRNLMAGKRP